MPFSVAYDLGLHCLSASSGLKVLALYLLVLSAENLCEQF